MVSIEEFRDLAFSFTDVSEEPHFEKTSFRIHKKIFATLNSKENRATIKLNEIDQSVFCANPKYMAPVPNKWGKQGWTIIYLESIPKEMCLDALKNSYKLIGKQ